MRVTPIATVAIFSIGLLACGDENTSNPGTDAGVNIKKDQGNNNTDSGTATWKICRNDTECSGSLNRCVQLGSSTTGMCSRSCNAQNPCPGGGFCISAVNAGLYPSCAKGCSGVNDCPTGMKCATTADKIKACVPDGWSLTSSSGKCTEGSTKCNGSYLTACMSGKWQTESCDKICIAAGYSKADSCGYDKSKGQDICFCSNTACTTGQQKCIGTDLAQCQNGKWQTETCNSLCLKAGYGKASNCGYDSQKGMDTCFCLPASCTNGQQKCAGQNNLSVCESGSWNTYSCDTLCKKSGYGTGAGCAYDSTQGAETCACFNGLIGDKCVYQSDCKQGVCGAHGWCSKACTSDSECSYNSTGNRNYCMAAAGGGFACFPSCTSTLVECMFYPGAICMSAAQSASGASAKVCSP